MGLSSCFGFTTVRGEKLKSPGKEIVSITYSSIIMG
jgi:hypothetical protein